MSYLEASLRIRRPRLDVELQLEAASGSIVALIGPNGAGKSTVVDALCGLLPLDRGKVTVAEAVWEDVAGRIRLPPQRRSVGVAFQALSLFPRMTAEENVAYGIRALGARKSEARRVAAEVLERLGASDLAHTGVERLAGGKAQKVALARALAIEPDLLLLDEPTSKLDVTSQMEVRRSLLHALRDFAGVTLWITHQPMETLAVATDVVVMEQGSVTQCGTPDQLQLRPRSPYVAEFAGVNLLEGRSTGDRVVVPGGASVTVADAPLGDVFVAIHPNAIALHRQLPEGTPRNVWRLDVGDIEYEGDRARIGLIGDLTLVAEVTPSAVNQLRLGDKGQVWATVKATQVRTYPR
jgi:molybdate transport system ATP-binding protein